MSEKKDYQLGYDDLLAKLKNNSVMSSDEVGTAVVEAVQHYINYNNVWAKAEINCNARRAAFETTVDENGKAISSAKAKVLSDASEEANALVWAETDVKNVEAIVNGLKSLQRAMTNEYNHQ